MWQKVCSVVLAVVLIAAAVLFFNREPRGCFLCNSIPYHAPCLIDLEAGEMIELGIYLLHETKAAELADPQINQGTFSFLILGDAIGYCDTTQERIEIEIPVEKTDNPMLCKECRTKLIDGNTDRYVLADLYDKEEKTLISIDDDLSIVLRCYEITATKNEDGMLNVIVHGILE